MFKFSFSPWAIAHICTVLYNSTTNYLEIKEYFEITRRSHSNAHILQFYGQELQDHALVKLCTKF